MKTSNEPLAPNPAQIVAGFGDIAANYDAVLCDVWGVLHNGKAAFPLAVEALRGFRRAGGTVVMLTNAPRPSEEIPAQFEALGVPRDCWDGIVTSGDATKAMLGAAAPGPAFKLGPPKDDKLYLDTGMEFAALEAAKLISCTGLFDDLHDTPAVYEDLLTQALERDLPMICANPDLVVHYGDTLIYCAGALAQLYTQLGGLVHYGGKPHHPIYALAMERLAQMRGQRVERSRVLTIGDGLGTDVAGAAAQKLDCLFISGGIHGDQIQGQDYGKEITKLLAAKNAHAKYAMPTLQW